MESTGPVPYLMIGTIGAALIIAIVLLRRFLSKPKNRHPMEGKRERNLNEIRRDGPDP